LSNFQIAPIGLKVGGNKDEEDGNMLQVTMKSFEVKGHIGVNVNPKVVKYLNYSDWAQS